MTEERVIIKMAIKPEYFAEFMKLVQPMRLDRKITGEQIRYKQV